MWNYIKENWARILVWGCLFMVTFGLIGFFRNRD